MGMNPGSMRRLKLEQRSTRRMCMATLLSALLLCEGETSRNDLAGFAWHPELEAPFLSVLHLTTTTLTLQERSLCAVAPR